MNKLKNLLCELKFQASISYDCSGEGITVITYTKGINFVLLGLSDKGPFVTITFNSQLYKENKIYREKKRSNKHKEYKMERLKQHVKILRGI